MRRCSRSASGRPATPADNSLDRVTRLLAEGRLAAAQQLLGTLSGDRYETGRELVDRQVEQVDTLRARAAEHRAAGLEDEAAGLLRHAVELAGDRRDLADELAALPLSPPPTVTAIAEGVGVRVAWRRSAGHPPGVRYRVVRQVGRVPVDPADGDVLAATDGLTVLDEAPPVGCRAAYAVFATAGSGPPWSRPAGAIAEVVPPVVDVALTGERDAVVGRWRMHPGATTVEVRRAPVSVPADEVPVPVSEAGSFRDTVVDEGVEYRYTLVARYPAADGGEPLRSAPVVARAALLPEAAPVPELAAAPANLEHGRAIHLTWRQPVGTEVAIRRTAGPCRWGYGEHVPASDLAADGEELAGTRGTEGERVTVVADVPSGTWHYTAYTTTPEGGVRGAEAVLEVVAPVGRPEAQRHGSEFVVGWDWPDDSSLADVEWSEGARRITRRQYNGGAGGFRAPARSGPEQFTVRVVVTNADGREVRSVAAVATVAAEPPAVRNSLQRVGSRWRRDVHYEVTLTSDAEVPGCTVVLVAEPGPALPREARPNTELAREVLDVGPNAAGSVHRTPRPAQETALGALFPSRAPRRAPPGTSCWSAGGEVMPIRSGLPVLLRADQPLPAGVPVPRPGRARPGRVRARSGRAPPAAHRIQRADATELSRARPVRTPRRVPAMQGDVRAQVCPQCHTPLPPGFGHGGTPLVGMVSSKSTGKTVYLAVLHKELTRNVRRRFQADVRLSGDHLPVGATVGPPRAWIENYETSLFDEHVLPEGTAAAQDGRRVPLVVECGPGNVPGERRYRTTVLSFYDAAVNPHPTAPHPLYLRASDG